MNVNGETIEMSPSAVNFRLLPDEKRLFEAYCRRIGNKPSDVMRSLVKAFCDASRRCAEERMALVLPYELYVVKKPD